MSDSSRPHGLQATRLLRPWDFPGKRTGAGAIDETVLFAAVWMHLEITRQGRQVSYDITYMWNLKYDTTELIDKTEIDSLETVVSESL